MASAGARKRLNRFSTIVPSFSSNCKSHTVLLLGQPSSEARDKIDKDKDKAFFSIKFEIILAKNDYHGPTFAVRVAARMTMDLPADWLLIC